MKKIKVPATSANIGPGFDCLGIAWDIYNTFTINMSNKDILHGTDPRFNNSDNLFLKAFHKTCDILKCDMHIEATFQCDIPVSRGLGSSAALLVGGSVSAFLLSDLSINKDIVFAVAEEMEGHPDNAAPAVYGGLCASMENTSVQLPLSDKFHYTVYIPGFEVSTEEARKILPESYPRSIATKNSAHAILLVQALAKGDIDLLKKAGTDYFHEPYRKTLIAGFDTIKTLVTNDASGIFLISGSGSTCLSITEQPISSKTEETISQMGWKVQQVMPSDGIIEVNE